MLVAAHSHMTLIMLWNYVLTNQPRLIFYVKAGTTQTQHCSWKMKDRRSLASGVSASCWSAAECLELLSLYGQFECSSPPEESREERSRFSIVKMLTLEARAARWMYTMRLSLHMGHKADHPDTASVLDARARLRGRVLLIGCYLHASFAADIDHKLY